VQFRSPEASSGASNHRMTGSSHKPRTSSRPRRREEGYYLLALMLVVALIAIAAAVAAPTIAFEIKRDKEQEMIHRGVQYTRAIQAYYKKFGRYPTRLEDLDNTNNLRYLRKHYKDPLNKNLDFKLLHYGDPGVSLAGGFGGGGGGITGANTVGQLNAAGAGNSAFGGSAANGSAFGQSSGFGGGNSSFGGGQGGLGGNSGSSFGGNSNSSFGGGFNNNSSNSTNSNSTGGSSSGPGTTAPTGTDPSQTATSTSPDPGSTTGAAGSGNGQSGQGNNQTFGGGPIVGVASLSKETTIREYNKKKKYNEWQFVYDPSADRGGLIRTPYQPSLATGIQNLNGQNGQPGTTGTNSSPFGSGAGTSFGSGSSLGQSSGLGNNNSSFGSTSPQPPNSNPSPPQ
jgi:type II secretory pathway pseudopilin PulG